MGFNITLCNLDLIKKIVYEANMELSIIHSENISLELIELISNKP